jgi:hypothetical protein
MQIDPRWTRPKEDEEEGSLEDVLEGGAEGDKDGPYTSVDEIADVRDVELEIELAEEEAAIRRADEEAGKAVEAVVYTPAPKLPWPKIAAVLVVAIILLLSVYFFLWPRADAELVIRYNEGLVSGINVDARLENHGTRPLEGVIITITVQNSTDVQMADPYTYEGSVPSYGQASLDAITFSGDQWDTYHIFVSWNLTCAGDSYQGSEHYNTEGDTMNIWYSLDLTE